MKKVIIFLVLISSLKLSAQNNICLHFNAFIDGRFLVLNEQNLFDNNEISISKLKFYISKLKFFKNNKEVYYEYNSFHLIDFNDEKTRSFSIALKKKIIYDSISFVLGIDSNTNHSGVLGGDLDPTKGMYWAWQSGYINFKIEGTSELCKSKTNEFTLHLGGFLNGNRCDEKVMLKVKNQEEININLDLTAFFKNLNLSKQNQIMSPGKEAISISKQLVKCFTIIENED